MRTRGLIFSFEIMIYNNFILEKDIRYFVVYDVSLNEITILGIKVISLRQFSDSFLPCF